MTTLQVLWLLGVGTYYLRYYACWLLAIVIVLTLLRVFRRRLPALVRRIAIALICVSCLRVVLFDNPWTLRLYQWSLNTDSLGYRQGGTLDLEIRKYRQDIDQPELANLAVGSSQVGAIFYQWSSPPPHPVGVFSLAGMKPLDFVLNEEAIAAMNPARVILYLSAFDMTGSPELYSLPLAPPVPSKIWPVYSTLRKAGLTEAQLAPTIHAYIFSQLLPEYRYSFVYRAFLRKWFHGAPHPTDDGRQLPQFSNYFEAEWLDYNFLFFRQFLAFCQAHHINVMIVEGQINPAARTPKITELDAVVRTRVHELMREFGNVSYVPAADIYEFSAEEYHDTVHVHEDAARRFTAQFSKFLK